MIDFLRDQWQGLTAFFGWVAGGLWWLFRLEAQGKRNAENHTQHVAATAEAIRAIYKLRTEDTAEAVRQRAEDREAAAEARKQAHDMLVILQQDVKLLLQRGR